MKKLLAGSLPLVAAMVLGIAGCGQDGPSLGQVTGKVTLDNQPVKNALVEYHPQDGRASTGTTDAEGKYELHYTGAKRGALLGTHQVRITLTDDDGESLEGSKQLPAKYNEKSELSAEVKSGSNEQNFDLKSN